MSDITKCPGTYRHGFAVKYCPYAQYCYRFTAEPSFMQSWFAMSPYKPNTSYKCSHYMTRKISTEDEYKVLMEKYMSMLISAHSDVRHAYLANRLRLKSAIRRLKEQQ